LGRVSFARLRSESELHSLRHLLAGPLGPNDLARTLGVTSAASSGIVDAYLRDIIAAIRSLL